MFTLIRALYRTRFVQQYQRLFATTTLLVWVWLGMYGLLFYTPQYASEAMAMVKDSAITRGYVNLGQFAPEEMKTTSSATANPVLNTMALLRSSEMSDALWLFFLKQYPQELDRLNIHNKTQWQHYFKDGSKLIEAKNKTGTDLIQIRFLHRDPVIAQAACKAAVEAFQEASLKLNRYEQTKRSQFLAEKIKEVSKELQSIRREKSVYKRKTNTLSTEFESEALTNLRSRFERDLNTVASHLDGKRAELARYQSALGMSPKQALQATAVGMNDALTKLKNNYYTLSQTIATQAATLTEKNPKLIESRAKLAQVEQDIQTELRRTLGSNTSLDSVMTVTDETRGKVIQQMLETHAGAIGLEQQFNALNQRLRDINTQIQAFPEVEEGIHNIEQTEKALSQSLDSIRSQYMEATLKEAQTLSNIFVVDAPSLPEQASFPAPLHFWLMALLAGPIAAVGVIMTVAQVRASGVIPNLITALNALPNAVHEDADHNTGATNAPATMVHVPVNELIPAVVPPVQPQAAPETLAPTPVVVMLDTTAMSTVTVSPQVAEGVHSSLINRFKRHKAQPAVALEVSQLPEEIVVPVDAPKVAQPLQLSDSFAQQLDTVPENSPIAQQRRRQSKDTFILTSIFPSEAPRE